MRYSISSWMKDFLAARNLEQPTGQFLFAYKVSDKEYQELTDCLRFLADIDPTQKNIEYPRAFLMYAAEWWRREYAGGAWQWDKLLSSINLNHLSTKQRSDMVLRGVRAWKIRTKVASSGKKYIGMVAANGGIPNQLLQNAQGKLADLLQDVIKHFPSNRGFDADELKAFIKERENYIRLPNSYRIDDVYNLLTDIVISVLDIRKKKDGKKLTFAELDTAFPDWKDKFPMAIDDGAAKRLIEGLVSVHIEKIATVNSPIRIKRGLLLSDRDSEPLQKVFIEVEKKVKEADFFAFLNRNSEINTEHFPSSFELYLRASQKEMLVAIGARRVGAFEMFKKGSNARVAFQDSFRLIVRQYGAMIGEISLAQQDGLNEDEPWFFEDEKTSLPCDFLKQGDGKLKGGSVLAVVAEGTQILPQPFECVAKLTEYRREILRIHEGNYQLLMNGERFEISVSEKNAADLGAHWFGRTLDVIQSSPSLIFLGKPRLELEEEVTQNKALFARQHGREQTLTSFNGVGFCTLLWRKNGQVRLRNKAILLPPEASISYDSGEDINHGEILFAQWPSVKIISLDENIATESVVESSGVRVYLENKASSPASSVSLCLMWSEGRQTLRLPFPGAGVIFKKDDTVIADGERLSIEELEGSYIDLLPGMGSNKWVIDLEIRGRHALLEKKIYHRIYYQNIRDIRLESLQPIIAKMLSCFFSLDVYVELQVRHEQALKAHLNIGKYATAVTWDQDKKRVMLTKNHAVILVDETAARGLLLALPLATQEAQPIALPMNYSENVFTDSWQVDLSREISTAWLIYVRKETCPELQYTRPTATSFPNEDAATNAVFGQALINGQTIGLNEALCESNASLRLEKLQNALQVMFEDTNLSDWTALNNLLANTEHLPFASLDIWRALIANPEGLILALLRVEAFSQAVALKLAEELPFEWLLISPSDWDKAFAAFTRSVDEKYSQLYAEYIKESITFLYEEQPALNFIVELLLYKYFHVSNDAQWFLKNRPYLLSIYKQQLFLGENPLVQQLYRRNGAKNVSQWPRFTDVRQYLHTDLGKQLLQLSKLTADDFKLDMALAPFVIARDCAQGKGGQWQNEAQQLFLLREFRDFDTDWFDQAYQYGLMLALDELEKEEHREF